jgi:hypothetical protein
MVNRVGRALGELPRKHLTWLSGGLTIAYTFMKNLRASLNYRLTLRDSDLQNRGYTQNLVGLQLTYSPK